MNRAPLMALLSSGFSSKGDSAYDSVVTAISGMGKYFDFYNRRRPHTALAGRTPDPVCFDLEPLAAAA